MREPVGKEEKANSVLDTACTRILKLQREPYYRTSLNTDNIRMPKSKASEHSYFFAWSKHKNLQVFLQWKELYILNKTLNSHQFLFASSISHYSLQIGKAHKNAVKVAWCVHAFVCYATQQSSATLGLEQHTEAAHVSRGKKQSIFIHCPYYCGFYHVNFKDSFTIFWGQEPYCCTALLSEQLDVSAPSFRHVRIKSDQHLSV